VSEAGDLLIDPARASFERALTGRGYRPFAEIKVAELGEDAGIVGAADLARQTLARETLARETLALETLAQETAAAQAAAAQPAAGRRLLSRPLFRRPVA
jgi:hypothetical protein